MRVTRKSIMGLTLCLLVSCSRDPIKHSIRKLGGSEADNQQATMELRLTSRDPLPALIDAVNNDRNSNRIRTSCLSIVGDIAKRQQDKRAFAFLTRMLTSDNPQFRETAVRGFIGTHCEEAVTHLINLQDDADKELLKLIDEALESTSKHLAKEVGKRWNSPDAAMAEYERLETMGLIGGHVGYSKAQFLEVRGRTAEAEQKYTELGMIRRYWVMGPFPNRQGMGFRRSYPPEKQIDLKATYTAGYGDAEWYLLDRDLHRGLLDFEHYFVEIDNVVGYALTFVYSDREQPAEVRCGSDDAVVVFLNGELIWANEQYRGAHFDDDKVEVTLRKGANALLFKVCEDWGAWQLIGRVTGPGDTPLTGVRITTDPPDVMPF